MDKQKMCRDTYQSLKGITSILEHSPPPPPLMSYSRDLEKQIFPYTIDEFSTQDIFVKHQCRR